MNKLKKKSDPGLTPFFTKDSTKSFRAEMDAALRTMGLMEVIQVLINYDIILKPDVKEFMDAFREVLEGWKKPGQDSEVIKVLPATPSRCIACEYGKDMEVYEFHYKHTSAPEPHNYLIYSHDFGMMYEVNDGILHNIRICNAFLNKTEMEELNKDNGE